MQPLVWTLSLVHSVFIGSASRLVTTMFWSRLFGVPMQMINSYVTWRIKKWLHAGRMHVFNWILVEGRRLCDEVLINESLPLDYALHLYMFLRTLVLENVFLKLELKEDVPSIQLLKFVMHFCDSPLPWWVLVKWCVIKSISKSGKPNGFWD